MTEITAARLVAENENLRHEVLALRTDESRAQQMADEIIRLQAEVARLREEARWIPTDERLPECDALVVLWVREIPEPLVDIAFCDDDVWFYRTGGMVDTDDTTVTHWRPLPALPALPEVTK